MNTPLVSCIMPTANRRRFVPDAIGYFLRQDYPNKELVILDDGIDPVEDLVPPLDSLRYIRLARKTALGAKRNLACEAAHGDLLMHWDDDDWFAPRRISLQVDALLERSAEICGLRQMLFYDPQADQTWLYTYPNGQRAWLAGGSLLYTRAFWRQAPFPSVDIGEDTRFIWSRQISASACMEDYRFYVAMIHSANTSPKQTSRACWKHWQGDLAVVMGEDLEPTRVKFCLPQPLRSLPQKPAIRTAEPQPTHIFPQRSRIAMMTTAKHSDLALPEYAAFNANTPLPKMRRWELPFALFHARLGNSMAVLDCSINPTSFKERIASLYPEVHYRSWSPLQNNHFQLPLLPDQAFERVFCINTLEHLLHEQRAALIAEMARKLKPGGLLILTSDYYFDTFWQDPACFNTGLLRADRQEVLGGYNRVNGREWIELCHQCGLVPLEDPALPNEETDPDPADPGLYRQDPPVPHACLGGVFVKALEKAEPQPLGKKVSLALLTWNTRQVTLESLQKHIREAEMLRRLGLQPFICVVDNGSADGTQAELSALDAGLEIPHRFILNAHNRGSSIARNQIIDASLDFGADYILLMDGDIEIVPFSSFAMLRYMENCGRRLGCIGADSANFSANRAQVTPTVYSLENMRKETTSRIAWTQYGMFRREIFEAGIRFDETEPFNQAGWGFEDNDLAFQMMVKSFLCQRFFGMTYLHRAIRSSVQNMHREGIDANHLFSWRKQYLLEKWKSVPSISGNLLEEIRMINIRL